MRTHRAGNIKLLVVASVMACGGDAEDRGYTTSVAAVSSGASGAVVAGGALRWRNDTSRELDGDDENQERLVATASKGAWDVTIVVLELRSSKVWILYRPEWPAVAYTKYGASLTASVLVCVFRETDRWLARNFSVSAFLLGS